ncbi:hypothetical protein ACFQNJ_19260 [Hydrogenophaga bisanensis]|uniref:Lipoprotein n=1 Tax=Hydrogenophaga bisanensis TaxID=439611 RepID=A0ABW2REU8_9BURK
MLNKKFIFIGFGILMLSGCGGNIDLAKKKIESSVSDPSSLQYRDVKGYSEGVVCGEFNAKNKMGGYAGFSKFIFSVSGDQLDATPSEDKWSYLCNDGEKKQLKFSRSDELKKFVVNGLIYKSNQKIRVEYSEKLSRLELEVSALESGCMRSKKGVTGDTGDCSMLMIKSSEVSSLRTSISRLDTESAKLKRWMDEREKSLTEVFGEIEIPPI